MLHPTVIPARGALIFSLLFSGVAAAQETIPAPVGERQLFLDDEGIAGLDGLRRTLHPPQKRGPVIRPDQPWESALQTRCAPVWDEDAMLYKLWMLTSTPVEGVAGTTYAESSDGVNWTKPILRQWKFRDSLENNFIAVDPDSAWPDNAMENVVYDPDDPDPNQRFKGFLGAFGRQPIVSPDGIHWKKLDVAPLPSQDESNLSYDRQTRTFIATLKVGGPFGRSHAIWTSRDFRQWTKTDALIHADEVDQQLAREHIRTRLADDQLQQPRYHDPADYNADIYNVGIFRYEGQYIALPAVYHATGKIPVGNTDGFHLIQLASSRDLLSWRRVAERQTWIGPSDVRDGAFDRTQLLPPSAPLFRDDELWFYYTGLKYRVPPDQPDPEGIGAICLAVLRRDGFVSLDAGSQPGFVTTKPFCWSGSRLLANVEAGKQGELRAEVLDAAGQAIATSQPLTGDHLQGEFHWKAGLPESLVGQQVSLRFTLRSASFYAWWLAE